MWQEESSGEACEHLRNVGRHKTFKPPAQTFATLGLDLVGHRLAGGRLELLSVLGTGAYGVVYLAVDHHAAQPTFLAVKCLMMAGLDARQRLFQRRELALHRLASRHPHVVTLHKIFVEGDLVFAVMDFCDEGDLFCMITERQRYLGNDRLIKKVFLQIIDAVEHCHSLGISHRDLKPENILCTKDGSQVRIADFGLATSEKTSSDFGCGSTFYISPECQGGLFERLERYSTRANDVWSLGVILVNLTCGRNPWRQACSTDETFRAYVNDPNFLRQILPISHSTNAILKSIFTLDPAQRVSLHHLRKMVHAVDMFTMTEAELCHAHASAQSAAASAQPSTPFEYSSALFVDETAPELEQPSYFRRDSESSSSDASFPVTPPAGDAVDPAYLFTSETNAWLSGKPQLVQDALTQ